MRSPTPALGLQIRYLWGDTLLQVSQHSKPESVYVGATQRCELRLAPPPGHPVEHALVSAWDGGFAVNVHEGLSGALERDGASTPLGPGSWDLLEADAVRVELGGGLRAELGFAPQPRRASAPLSQQVDYRFLNLALLCAFVAGAFTLTAALRSEVDVVADDLSGPGMLRLRDYVVPPPVRVVRSTLSVKSVPDPSPGSDTAPQASRPSKGGPSKKTEVAGPPKLAAGPLFDVPLGVVAAASVLGGGFAGGGGGGVGDGTLQQALQDLRADVLGDSAFSGIGSRMGAPGGGNGPGWVAIGGGGVIGRRPSNYGVEAGRLTPKKTGAGPSIAPDPPTISGSLPKELVREVIRLNVGKIRFCYEQSLQRNPALEGKVAVRFTIGSDGTVGAAQIDEGTTLRDRELSTCLLSRVRSLVFPMPKGGGTAIVRYPFLFKSAGE